MSTEPVTLILAEDDDGHAHLVERNLHRAGLLNNFLRVRDGQELIDFMHGRGEFGDRVLSESLVVLLDINMPRVDGIEALQQIKGDPALSATPVIMLTTTDDPREIDNCYKAGCNVYITKPVEYEAFIDAIKRLGMFLQIVKKPRSGRGRA